MRHVRRLPPLLRIVRIVGLLFIPTGIALGITSFVTNRWSAPHAFGDSARVWVIAMDVLWLSMACNFICLAYVTRVGRPGLGPFPLDSWQSQVRAIVLLSALPLCGIALALVIPPTSAAVWIIIPLSLLATIEMVVLLAAFGVGMAGTGSVRAPPTG